MIHDSISKNQIISVILGSLLVSVAYSQNLVTNPGFETGDITGWTLSGDKSGFVVTTSHTGSYSFKLTPGSSTNTLSQSLSTVANQTYDYSVWLFHDGGDTTSNSADVTWNGTSVSGFPMNLPPSSGWVDYNFSVIASSASTVISITAHDPVGNIFLDDVSVTQAVPEPAMLLPLFGAIGVIFLRKYRA